MNVRFALFIIRHRSLGPVQRHVMLTVLMPAKILKKEYIDASRVIIKKIMRWGVFYTLRVCVRILPRTPH